MRPSATKTVFLVALTFCLAMSAQAAEPKLVLQITVDQLRGDILPRFHDRFGQGGFRRLMDSGLFFANAQYGTANTEPPRVCRRHGL